MKPFNTFAHFNFYMLKRFTNTRSHLFLLIANLIYGINFSVAKSVMPESIKPLALVAFRTAVSALLFWGTSLFLPKEKVGRKDLFFLFMCSFIGVVLNQTLFLAGLNLTTPINSAIILTMNPIAAFIFAAFILKEDISLIRGTGLAVGLAGVMLLILQGGRPDFGSSTFLGNLLTLASTINWALYTVLIKKMLVKYQPVTVMKWTFLFSLLTTVPMGYSQLSTTGWSDFTLISWTSLAFVIVAATFLGYLLISSGLRNLSPTVVSSYTYSQPLIAALIASMMGQDKIDMIKILSAILIFAGVYLVSKPDSFKIGTLKKSPVELP